MAKRFDGQSVLITGASSGIGAAVAIEFARQGARVALGARRVDKLEAVKKKIEAGGGSAICVPCDVLNRANIEDAVRQTVEAFGGIDIVLANAGFGVAGPFVKLSTDDYRRQFDTNFFGVLDTLYATLPHVKKSRGRIGVVGSVAGRLGSPMTSAYAASKFAVVGLAESLYAEFASVGVSLTLINPGFVESEIRFLDNHGKYMHGRKDPAPAWLVVSAEKAAREIVSAMHRRKAEAVITGHGKVLVFFARHFPRTVRTITRMGVRAPRNT